MKLPSLNEQQIHILSLSANNMNYFPCIVFSTRIDVEPFDGPSIFEANKDDMGLGIYRSGNSYLASRNAKAVTLHIHIE